MQTLRQAQEWSARSKAIFKKYDPDGNGYINRNNLRKLITSISQRQISEREIDQCISEADSNGNGLIEFDEFVEWLLKPTATVRMGDTGLEFFDLEAVLRPLYKVYDANGDGNISMEEFVECQSILRNSLGLRSCTSEERFIRSFTGPAGFETQTPESPKGVLEAEPVRIFSKVDTDHSQSVSFREFVDWQREALRKAGTRSEHLEELLPALARQLQRVFKFSTDDDEEDDSQCDQKVLQRIIDNLAQFSTQIWTSKEVTAKRLSLFDGVKHYTNRWSEPPIGLNIHRLTAKHLATSASSFTRNVLSTDFDLLVIPELESHIDAVDPRRWLAKLIRKVTYKSGKTKEDDPAYYEFQSLQWTMTDKAKVLFDTAWESLPPELKVFCLLKVEANFGVRLQWSGVQRALERSTQFGIFTAAQHQEYNKAMELRVLKAMKEEDIVADIPRAKAKETLMERLKTRVVQRPREVMATLSDLEIFKVSSVWADFMMS